MEKNYCGIVSIGSGSGSSWAYGDTPEVAAKKASQQCRRDWKHLYKIPRKGIKVNILDMHNHDGWEASTEGIFDIDTGEPIEIMKVITI